MGSDREGLRFTEGSFEAARLLVSRLQAEVYGNDWDSEMLGITWLAGDETPVCQSDEGVTVHFGDLMMASLSLLFSLFEEIVDISDHSREELVARIGVGVAELAPDPEES